MKTLCPPGYHHNNFVATDSLGHMMYLYIIITVYHVPKLPQSYCGDNRFHDNIEDVTVTLLTKQIPETLLKEKIIGYIPLKLKRLWVLIWKMVS